MLLALEVVSMFFTAVAMSMALAHALEFLGKMRLNPQTYNAVQTIYYPGFTIENEAEWKAIRAQWEYSHIVRALLACIAVITLAMAVAM